MEEVPRRLFQYGQRVGGERLSSAVTVMELCAPLRSMYSRYINDSVEKILCSNIS